LEQEMVMNIGDYFKGAVFGLKWHFQT